MLALVCTNHTCPTYEATKADFHSISINCPAWTVESMKVVFEEADALKMVDPQAAELLMKRKGLVNEMVCMTKHERCTREYQSNTRI